MKLVKCFHCSMLSSDTINPNGAPPICKKCLDKMFPDDMTLGEMYEFMEKMRNRNKN